MNNDENQEDLDKLAKTLDEYNDDYQSGRIEVVDDREKIKTRYQSQDGFVDRKVMRGWFEIQPLLEVLKTHGGFVCGGYARWCVSPHREPAPASDVDVYCENESVFEELKDYFGGRLTKKFENAVAIQYSRPNEGRFAALPPIQLIKPIHEGKIVAVGDMKTVLENFDFTVIRCGLYLDKPEALVDADFEHDEEKRLLRIKNIHCPISSTQRFIKYGKKGYWVRNMEILKLFLDWDGRGEDYREELNNFLTRLEGEEGLTDVELQQLYHRLRID